MRQCICDGCGKQMKKKVSYCLRIELFAAPEVEFDENDLKQDRKKVIEQIFERAKKMDSKKLEEEVYICYDLNLCKSCRDKFASRIECKEFI